MATMGDVVTRALRRLRVVNPRETVEAIHATDGLTALNEMMFSWKGGGVDTDHSELEATDDFPLDDEHVQGTAALLAVRLAGDHGVQIDFGIERDAARGWAALEAEFVTPVDVQIDPGLLRFGRCFG